MTDQIEKILARSKSKKWIAYVCVSVLILNGLGSVAENTRKIYQFVSDSITILTHNKFSDQDLEKKTILLSIDILNFLLNREKNAPETIRPNILEIKKDLEEKKSVLLITNYTEVVGYILDTQSLFDEKFMPSVELIRNEFLKRGIRDKDIDKSLENEIYDYQLIAYKLIGLTENL